MTDERAGQLNESSIVKDSGDVIYHAHYVWHADGMGFRNSEWSSSDEYAGVQFLKHLVKRGLINELGIEILKRDGVIK